MLSANYFYAGQNKLNPRVHIKNTIKFYEWIITGLICIVFIFAKPDLL